MQERDNDLRISLKEEGHQLIQQNYKVFTGLISKAGSYLQCNQYEMAAIYADMADEYASWMGHCGFFTSPELEQILLTIGKLAIKNNYSFQRNPLLGRTPKRILHVVPEVWPTGGHSRLLWRWIQQDNVRSHSVVLTKMTTKDAPEILRNAVFNTNGKLHELNSGSLILRAKRLRDIAASADVVILHTIYDGTIATIAFADKDQSPPTIYVNHADERFWTGVKVSDVVVNLRESGMRLSQVRRGVEPNRNLLLPTILKPIQRSISRLEAKKQLGIDENSVLLLSIARGVKYRTSDGSTFADAHVKLLEKYQQAILIVVGPQEYEDWSEAVQQSKGRIRVIRETPETDLFYQAADIYVDSYPFVSITSLLEAGSYSLPLVSRYPYSTDECEIFGADMPGLTGNLMRARNQEDYQEMLSNLIENEESRLSLGERTRQQIQEIHTGSNWQQSLEKIYAHAVSIEPLRRDSFSKDKMCICEPDTLLQKVCPFNNPDLDKLVRDRVRLMTINERFSFWLQQLKKGDFGRTGNISFLLPEWLYKRFKVS